MNIKFLMLFKKKSVSVGKKAANKHIPNIKIRLGMVIPLLDVVRVLDNFGIYFFILMRLI